MLKGIPHIISPELFYVLMSMGHGDEIVFGDANFPADSMAERIVRSDGHRITDLLEAVLPFFPLDDFVEQPAAIMQKVPGDATPTPIWDTYRKIVEKHEKLPAGLEQMERFAFYERAKKAYAIVATGETALYANIILKKGVVRL